MYPLGHLERTCAKEYTFNGTNVTVKPGTLIQMPTVAMMKDPKFFEDPLTFDPTRWGKDESARRNPYLLHTFGKKFYTMIQDLSFQIKHLHRTRPKILHWQAVRSAPEQDGIDSVDCQLQNCSMSAHLQRARH